MINRRTLTKAGLTALAAAALPARASVAAAIPSTDAADEWADRMATAVVASWNSPAPVDAEVRRDGAVAVAEGEGWKLAIVGTPEAATLTYRGPLDEAWAGAAMVSLIGAGTRPPR